MDVFPSERNVRLVAMPMEGEFNDFPTLILKRGDALHYSRIAPLVREKGDGT